MPAKWASPSANATFNTLPLTLEHRAARPGLWDCAPPDTKPIEHRRARRLTAPARPTAGIIPPLLEESTITSRLYLLLEQTRADVVNDGFDQPDDSKDTADDGAPGTREAAGWGRGVANWVNGCTMHAAGDGARGCEELVGGHARLLHDDRYGREVVPKCRNAAESATPAGPLRSNCGLLLGPGQLNDSTRVRGAARGPGSQSQEAKLGLAAVRRRMQHAVVLEGDGGVLGLRRGELVRVNRVPSSGWVGGRMNG